MSEEGDRKKNKLEGNEGKRRVRVLEEAKEVKKHEARDRRVNLVNEEVERRAIKNGLMMLRARRRRKR